MCSTWLGWSRVLMGSPCTHTECPILLFLTGELGLAREGLSNSLDP